MSNLVKVVNTNSYPYKEVFQSKIIEIPENGGSIVMDKDKAHLFLGTANSVRMNADGTPNKQDYKRLHIEPYDPKAEIEPVKRGPGRPPKDVSESI